MTLTLRPTWSHPTADGGQLTGYARQVDQGRLTYISDRDAQDLLAELRKVDWADAMRALG